MIDIKIKKSMIDISELNSLIDKNQSNANSDPASSIGPFRKGSSSEHI